PLLADRPSLLFVHGLGDSGKTFQEVFEDSRFESFNILAPDLAGYGRSSASADYSFGAHTNRLWNLIEKLESRDRVDLERLIVVGHSLGGDITTLFCDSDRRGKVSKYVNIEGDITQFDLFISGQAVEAASRGEFKRWFESDFMEQKVYAELGTGYESCRRYYASLHFARQEAFLANARELYNRNTSVEGEYKSEIGKIYCSLRIPKVFCYGTNSISPETVRFLERMGLESKSFPGAFHWLMVDAREEFYSFLHDYASRD
ncbi:MAG TPA: alpha/beta hydrolase, partial [Blastocatellia bacterium]